MADDPPLDITSKIARFASDLKAADHPIREYSDNFASDHHDSKR
jgi:hypothetical protein